MPKANWISNEVCTIEGFLSPIECSALVARSEAMAYEEALISRVSGAARVTEIRNNDRVIWDDPSYAAELWRRLKDVIPPVFHNVWRAAGLNERLRFYRYEPGQFFDWHSDGTFWRSQHEESHFTFMIYLNDDCEGGETAFRQGPDQPDQDLIVVPKTGMALMFRHKLWHRGSEVLHGRKYVLRTDVMYQLAPGN